MRTGTLNITPIAVVLHGPEREHFKNVLVLDTSRKEDYGQGDEEIPECCRLENAFCETKDM